MELTVKTFDELTTTELYEILRSRAAVFTVEQTTCCQDMDRVDYTSYHCFYKDGGTVTAYLRAYYNEGSKDTVKIGRVLTLDHGKGLGRRLMEESIEAIKAKLPCKKMLVHAQKQAIGYYEKFGFQVTSGEFWEDGIVHVTMELAL